MNTWDTILYLLLLGLSALLYLINYRALTPALKVLSIVQFINFVAMVYAVAVVQFAHSKNNLYVLETV
ncbi:hypothetical protein GCM10027190_10960 [Spirosoma areae]